MKKRYKAGTLLKNLTKEAKKRSLSAEEQAKKDGAGDIEWPLWLHL